MKSKRGVPYQSLLQCPLIFARGGWDILLNEIYFPTLFQAAYLT